MPTQIRAYDVADGPAIVELSLRAWEPVFASLEAVLGTTIFARLHPDWRADQRRAVEGVLADEATDVWVGELDERVAGFVAVVLHPGGGIGEIYMLAVDPELQGGGIGTQLTAYALDRIADAGYAVAMVDSGGDPGHAPGPPHLREGRVHAPPGRPVLQGPLSRAQRPTRRHETQRERSRRDA